MALTKDIPAEFLRAILDEFRNNDLVMDGLVCGSLTRFRHEFEKYAPVYTVGPANTKDKLFGLEIVENPILPADCIAIMQGGNVVKVITLHEASEVAHADD